MTSGGRLRSVRSRTIGLTGGIGSGKSAVARILAELGAYVVDADRVGHEVYRPGTVGWDRVVAAFGRDVVAADGTIDRRVLGSIVFSDPQRLAELNGIVHPLIRETVRSRVGDALAERPGRPVVVEAALLVEARWYDLVDEVWVVTAPADVVLERVTRDRSMDPAALRARIAAQSSDEERLRIADVVVANEGSLDDLRRQVEHLWRERCSG